ncbi:UDP-N-acetylhexosamine pyrophosphorylase [Zancudomyces culisetae]|uniref:UDP-N-acetylglucosamine diphosphorylase n=1 Tax=Zancudomyces culisetae TaxID=1213189 RepID=A0A1R1PKR2_ZANCU|nr:UDP-N-acetylhexosamine pyrophosphorylase [Zancudomyces culisetae]OMH81472.1 UDP-N-acetylhexosamine pyrophosphorylase [Zancudomyces culisetae]|eukprot:OMH78898.1 UDP-N-acetylhexosamine pyrophosphorylase [Zancudomyces culisetae]
MMASNRVEGLRKRYAAVGQEHVFQYVDELGQNDLDGFLNTLEKLNIEKITERFKKTMELEGAHIISNNIEPLETCEFDSEVDNKSGGQDEWYEEGLRLIAQNKVATLVMAGGQGTRLGSTLPKGFYKVGIPSGKSLFQIQGERIVRLQQVAAEFAKVDKNSVVIPWLVMVSDATKKDTVDYFRHNNNFGLRDDQVFFFDQGSLPAFTFDGKLILESKGKISTAPDGNGGIYSGLLESGILDELKRRGVTYVHAYCVDNILVRVADPRFVGYSALKKAQTGALVVAKSSWDEKVGVICKKQKKYAVLEYSEIPEELSREKRPDGTLLYNAGNICNHVFSLDFLYQTENIQHKLEYHIAKKKIKYYDSETGKSVAPEKNNGIKLERFIFDVFPFVDKLAILDVSRKEQFSPLKNAPGSGADCPETSREDLMNLHIRFAEKAGAQVIGAARRSFEISPLVSYNGEGLESLEGRVFSSPTLINEL